MVSSTPVLLIFEGSPAPSALAQKYLDAGYSVHTSSQENELSTLVGSLVPDLLIINHILTPAIEVALKKMQHLFPTQPYVVTSGSTTFTPAFSDNTHAHEITNAHAHGLIGKGPLFEEILRQFHTYVAAEVPLIIYGPAGSGKTVFARYAHTLRSQNQQAFIEVDCIRIAPPHFERILDRYMHDGNVTIYCHHIEHLSARCQHIFIQYLLAGFAPHIIASAQSDLYPLFRKKHLSAYLFAYLHAGAFALPSLVVRRNEIPFLSVYYLTHYNTILQKEHVLSQSAIRELSTHTWPGGISELKATLSRICTGRDAIIITGRHVQRALGKRRGIRSAYRGLKKLLRRLFANHLNKIFTIPNA